jgi:glucose-1-phosphate thymidylyltransferase
VAALGAIAKSTEGDLLVVAGDNLFTHDLNDLVDVFRAKHASVIALYRAKSLEEVKKGSEVTVDDEGKILEFIEKPSRPKSILVGGCIYVFPARIRSELKRYMKLDVSQDEPGRFIEWLHKREDIYGCSFTGYVWDIGTVESYRKTDEYFRRLAPPTIARSSLTRSSEE